MEPAGHITTYLWQRLPLILLFSGGYLVYLIMAATRLTDGFVGWALGRSRGSASMLLLYIIGAAAALSSFIPNTITVLTMLPILKRLDSEFKEQGITGMTTVLMCAAIYGAAIGGMGSMIGSPANAILLGALDFFQVPGREQITFFNWFLWSVPLVAMLVLAAWGVAAGVGMPEKARQVSVFLRDLGEDSGMTDRQRYGARLFWLYMGYWIAEAVARQVFPGFGEISPLLCTGFTILFLFLAFVKAAPTSFAGSGPLLVPGDLLKSIPRRGLIFVLGLVLIIGLAQWLGLAKEAALVAQKLLSGDIAGLLLFFLNVMAVIFLTEVLSNTTVVAAFFPIAYYSAQAHAMNPLYMIMGVSVASTCAFMTPIATPTSALAFGEMRGASLKVMVLLGLVLNLAGALLITGWLSWVLPLVY